MITPTNETKHSATLTNLARNIATLTNRAKNSVVLTTLAKNMALYVDFLLKEDSFHLLLETGGKIVIGDSYTRGDKDYVVMTNQSKN